jgi:hypothetical protein
VATSLEVDVVFSLQTPQVRVDVLGHAVLDHQLRRRAGDRNPDRKDSLARRSSDVASLGFEPDGVPESRRRRGQLDDGDGVAQTLVTHVGDGVGPDFPRPGEPPRKHHARPQPDSIGVDRCL